MAVWTLRLLRRTGTDIRQIGSTDFQRMTDVVRKGGIEAAKEDLPGVSETRLAARI
jgi:hypothetical protein